MNTKKLTMGLIAGTASVTVLGILVPEPSIAVTNVVMGGSSLILAFHLLAKSARRKISKTILEEMR